MTKKLNLISCLHQAKRNVSEARTSEQRFRWLLIQAILEGMINTQSATKEVKQEQGV